MCQSFLPFAIEAAPVGVAPGIVPGVRHELVFSIRLADGETLDINGLAGDEFAITSLPDRDPTLTAYLISFAASASLELVLALRRVAHGRTFTLAMKHHGRRLTLTTNDDGLDIDLLSRVMKDFYRGG
jgi:hypothetical protein